MFPVIVTFSSRGHDDHRRFAVRALLTRRARAFLTRYSRARHELRRDIVGDFASWKRAEGPSDSSRRIPPMPRVPWNRCREHRACMGDSRACTLPGRNLVAFRNVHSTHIHAPFKGAFRDDGSLGSRIYAFSVGCPSCSYPSVNCVESRHETRSFVRTYVDAVYLSDAIRIVVTIYRRRSPIASVIYRDRLDS